MYKTGFYLTGPQVHNTPIVEDKSLVHYYAFHES